MQDRQTLLDINGKVLLGMKEVLERKSRTFFVHGDTTTTFARPAAFTRYPRWTRGGGVHIQHRLPGRGA